MTRRSISFMLLAFAMLGSSLWAQSAAMQDKMALVKDAMQANAANLKAYTHQEHTQIYLKGEMKAQKNYQVVTGPDGKPQKTNIDPPAPPPQQSGRRRGRLKEEIKDKKVDEMKEYMQQAQQLIGQYVPPNPQKMQASFSSGGAAISEAGPGLIKLTFSNYVVSGDSMVLVFNSQTKKPASLSINSYLGEQKDTVTLTVTFAALPDGTNYSAMTDLVAKAKNIEVKTTNDNYRKM